jgi:two-component system, response regulator
MEQARTILLVDDSGDDVVLARAAFAQSGTLYNLIIAEDGVEALDYLLRQGDYAERHADAPDLVLLDLKLPGIDGFEVLRRIRSEQRTTMLPVVVFTSSIEHEDVERSYRLGANSYVRKPIDFDDFVPLAHKLAEYWLTINQPPSEDAET